MSRIALDDGKWFDDDKATCYGEDTRWDGSNHISKATGSQWEHEELYHTKGGTWVLHSWSQWQGSVPSYRIIGKEEAARWLSANGHEPEELAAEMEALEV